jgi:mRNA interferase HigB
MRLIGKERLQKFREKHSDARSQLDSWVAEVENADWKTPHDLKVRYPKASILEKRQAIFDICWNKYRIWVKVAYQTGIIVIKAVGTHKEYDNWKIE